MKILNQEITPVNPKTKELAKKLMESKNLRIVYLGKKMLKLENFEKVFLFPERFITLLLACVSTIWQNKQNLI